LLPGRFTRNGEPSDGRTQFFGAEKQMGLIKPFGLRRFIERSRKPTLIIWMTRLVHSDSGRLDRHETNSV